MTDPFIDETVRQRILAELDRIEREEDVRILFSVESGSRAWRFPSRDSDYDVRFVYVRPVEDYLAVKSRRDVIERPIDGVLDVGGWDLRKAIGLAVSSNATLLEWLNSPVWYRGDGTESVKLGEFAKSTADLSELSAHYYHMASRTFADVSVSGNSVTLKKYCYAIRTALAHLWLRWKEEVPPMDLPSLLAGLTLSTTVTDTVAELLLKKLNATESDTIPRNATLDELIAKVLSKSRHRFDAPDRGDVQARADALFASIVLDAFQARSR